MEALLLAGLASVGCEPTTSSPSATAARVDVQPIADVPAEALAPAGPRKLKWEEIDLPLGAAEKFEPWMLNTAVQALDGRTVRINGVAYTEGTNVWFLPDRRD